MTPDRASAHGAAAAFDAQVQAVMAASRVVVAVAAASVAQVEDLVTLPQLRVLVMVADGEPLNLGAVAAGLGVHPSNATRACDRLVAGGLLNRGEAAEDRRQLALTLTPAGRQLVDRVMRHRQLAVAEILRNLPLRQRRELAAAMESFAAAARPGKDVAELWI